MTDTHREPVSDCVAATAIERDGFGVLLRGPSGAGKSDLALRALSTPIALPGDTQSHPFQLISDDQTVLVRKGELLEASPPEQLAGRLEVRGLGIQSVPHVSPVAVRLVIDLTTKPIERMPDYPGPSAMLIGCKVDLLQISPFEASAPIKIALALRRAAASAQQKVHGGSS